MNDSNNLPVDTVICPKCAEEVKSSNVWYGRQLYCENCKTTFQPADTEFFLLQEIRDHSKVTSFWARTTGIIVLVYAIVSLLNG